MTTETTKKLKEFFRAFAGGPTPFLLVDYDGTLAPFRVDRFPAPRWSFAGMRPMVIDDLAFAVCT